MTATEFFKPFPSQTDVTMNPLQKNASFNGPRGPVMLVIMDGVGIGAGDAGDMVAKASTPTLDWLKENAIYTTCLLYTSPSPRD